MSSWKDDDTKTRLDLLPYEALLAVGRVMTTGARKYSDRNWEAGFRWGRVFAALMRHTWAWWCGEDNDKETGESHLAHAVCCGLFLLTYVIRGVGQDDRPWKRGAGCSLEAVTGA